MTIDEARQFILHHPEAELRGPSTRSGQALHARWLKAVEVVDEHRKAQLAALAKPTALDNPRYGRMRR